MGLGLSTSFPELIRAFCLSVCEPIGKFSDPSRPLWSGSHSPCQITSGDAAIFSFHGKGRKSSASLVTIACHYCVSCHYCLSLLQFYTAALQKDASAGGWPSTDGLEAALGGNWCSTPRRDCWKPCLMRLIQSNASWTQPWAQSQGLVSHKRKPLPQSPRPRVLKESLHRVVTTRQSRTLCHSTTALGASSARWEPPLQPGACIPAEAFQGKAGAWRTECLAKMIWLPPGWRCKELDWPWLVNSCMWFSWFINLRVLSCCGCRADIPQP